MKEKILLILVFCVGAFVTLKLIGPLPLAVNSVSTTKTDTFTVNGTGKVSVDPDIVRVTIGHTVQGSTVKQTREALNKTINAVKDALVTMQVAKQDIKTSGFSINPIYDWSNSKQRITGYSGTMSLQVTIRNMDSVNDIIDKATELGANEISALTFAVENPEKATNDARELAVSEAKKKAEDAARIAGFRLGNIVNYQENDNSQVNRPMAFKEATLDMAAGGNTEIQPGTSEISITVTLSYELQ